MSQVLRYTWACCPGTKAPHQLNDPVYKDPDQECLVYRQMATEAYRLS
jgi:hypothetical protein